MAGSSQRGFDAEDFPDGLRPFESNVEMRGKKKRPKKPPAKPVDAHGMTAIEAFKLGLKEAQEKREWEESQTQSAEPKPQMKRQNSGKFGPGGMKRSGSQDSMRRASFSEHDEVKTYQKK